MDDEEILAQLEGAARRLGVPVRYEDCGVPGGLCTVRGERVIIVERGADARLRARVLARALGEIGTEGLYLSPVVRELIDEA
jgi:hypothetical protein